MSALRNLVATPLCGIRRPARLRWISARQAGTRLYAHPPGGFTLIEVLLAVAILGAGMGMMLTAASRCLAAMKQARKYQEAQWTLNRGLLDYPLLPTEEVDDWNVSGETYENGLTFSRDVEDEPIEEEDGLFIVRSRVVWSEKGRESREEVVQYVLNLEAIE